MEPRHGPRSRLRHVTAVFVVALATIAVLLLIGSWQPSAIAFTALTMVLGFVYLCYLVWEIATGRVGLIHWAPTARRRRRLAAARAQAEALAGQHRLEAALSHGPYRPEPAAHPARNEHARARQELLEAIERHGTQSPQARAAADKLRSLRD